MESNKLTSLSQNLISEVKSKHDFSITLERLGEIRIADLLLLNRDSEKLCFWINLYNAYCIIQKKNLKPSLKSRLARKSFFKSKFIAFKDLKLSLDDIEHEILRKHKMWWSFGYISNPFPNKTLKKLSVDKLNPRIHFALNCGALSCPPIRFYSPENMYSELNIAAKAFVLGNSKIDKNKLITSPIFKWYRADFSGRKGIINTHNLFLQPTVEQDIKIHYMPYDWDLG